MAIGTGSRDAPFLMWAAETVVRPTLGSSTAPSTVAFRSASSAVHLLANLRLARGPLTAGRHATDDETPRPPPTALTSNDDAWTTPDDDVGVAPAAAT